MGQAKPAWHSCGEVQPASSVRSDMQPPSAAQNEPVAHWLVPEQPPPGPGAATQVPSVMPPSLLKVTPLQLAPPRHEKKHGWPAAPMGEQRVPPSLGRHSSSV